MERLTRLFKRQSPVAEIIEDNSAEWQNRDNRHESGIVQGYDSIRIQQPNVELITVKRKNDAAPTQSQEHSSVPSYRPYSTTGSFKTVLSRASDGKLVWVQRPIRDSVVVETSPAGSTRSSRSGVPFRTISTQSFSEYNRRSQRATMTSIMSVDNLALEEEHPDQQRGSSTTTGTAATASAASGNIQIGHVEEMEEDGFHSQYSESVYDENNGNLSEGEEAMYDDPKMNEGTGYGTSPPLAQYDFR